MKENLIHLRILILINVYFTDNKVKDVVLERELGLSNNINYNIEVANPQRFNETRLKKILTETAQ